MIHYAVINLEHLKVIKITWGQSNQNCVEVTQLLTQKYTQLDPHQQTCLHTQIVSLQNIPHFHKHTCLHTHK
jgi:hypothetical protein